MFSHIAVLRNIKSCLLSLCLRSYIDKKMTSNTSEGKKAKFFTLNLLTMITIDYVVTFIPNPLIDNYVPGPNANPMTRSDERAEYLEEIHLYLDALGRRVVPAGKLNGPGLTPGHDDRCCKLNHSSPAFRIFNHPIMGPRNKIYFQKLRMTPGKIHPGDKTDNAHIYFFSATRTSMAGRQPRPPPRGGLVNNALDVFGGGQIAAVICRRREIEAIKIRSSSDIYNLYNADKCSIDTWLAFMCFQDPDVQRDVFRDSSPDDYQPYLGDLPESRHLINMARDDCRYIMGVIPKQLKIGRERGINSQVLYAIRLMVIASQTAKFDYVMLKRKQKATKNNADCGPLFELRRNNADFYKATMGRSAGTASSFSCGNIPNRSGRDLMNEYEHNWLFCKHGTGNIRAPLVPHITGRRKEDIKEHITGRKKEDINAIPPSIEPGL